MEMLRSAGSRISLRSPGTAARLVPPPPDLLGQFARRVALVTRCFLFGRELCGLLCFFRRDHGREFLGFLAGLFGGGFLDETLALGFRRQTRAFRGEFRLARHARRFFLRKSLVPRLGNRAPFRFAVGTAWVGRRRTESLKHCFLGRRCARLTVAQVRAMWTAHALSGWWEGRVANDRARRVCIQRDGVTQPSVLQAIARLEYPPDACNAGRWEHA